MTLPFLAHIWKQLHKINVCESLGSSYIASGGFGFHFQLWHHLSWLWGFLHFLQPAAAATVSWNKLHLLLPQYIFSSPFINALLLYFTLNNHCSLIKHCETTLDNCNPDCRAHSFHMCSLHLGILNSCSTIFTFSKSIKFVTLVSFITMIPFVTVCIQWFLCLLLVTMVTTFQ